MRRILLSLVFLSLTFIVNAQNYDNGLAKQLVSKNAAAIGLSQDDLSNYIVSSTYFNQTGGTQMVYLVQGYKGLPVRNQMLVLAFKDGKMISKAGGFLPNLGQLTAGSTASPSVTAADAVRSAITESNLVMPAAITQRYNPESDKKINFGTLGLAKENVTAELMWVPVMNGVAITGIKLAWQVELSPLISSDYWSIRVDANNKTVIDKNNYTVFDSYGPNNQYLSRDNILFWDPTKHHQTFDAPVTDKLFSVTDNNKQLQNSPSLVTTVNYTVVRYPAENPVVTGGAPAVTTNPWTLAGGNAVTLGWHNDGTTDYTTSRGNNVHAHEDQANTNNNAGIMAVSTTTPDPLNFTYPIDFTVQPTTPNFQQFAITNLFYWNNILHDIPYKYGFDEPAGNFQNSNLGRGGIGTDYVQADAQDGAGLNNANMSTGPDGIKPRMQMFLWSRTDFIVNSPGAIAGSYVAKEGAMSTANQLQNVGPVTNQVVWYNDDAAGNTHYACNPPVNSVTGKIALISRGFGGSVCTATVPFTVKVKNAQNAGAVAVIIVNNVPGGPITMGGTDNTITIPAVMISDVDGATIAAQLANNVNVTLRAGINLDGDLDNGIVCHEFFHGVSNRLTGGPATTSCLNNAEQGGEGWSDYNGLMLNTNWATATVNDGFNVPRPIGLYVLNNTNLFAASPPLTGIRHYRYSTNMAVNPLTYADMGVTYNEVHDIGEIWAMALWEMTWAIIQTDGINPNLFNNAGAGGNSVAYKLMMEGLKLQPCSPGFIDARNAILQADQNLYAGAHYCAIYAAFAKRGMGFGALQGSSASTADQTPSFALPPGATFTAQPANATTCAGSTVSFTGTATNATGYQWQVSTTGCGGTFTNIPVGAPYTGTTTNTLTINPATIGMNGYAYRLVATTLCGSGNSSCAVLTVVAAAVGGTVTPANTNVCATPNSTLLTLSGNVGPVSYWEQSITGVGGPYTQIAGTAGQQTYTATNVTVTTFYRAFISATGCASASSSSASVTVLPGALPMFIVADPGNPSNPTVCAGDPERLTVMEGASSVPAPLYTQTVVGATNGIVSQQFEAANTAFNSQAADDFTVPAGGWNITQVTVAGIYFNGPGPATAVNVYFYTNVAGHPGAVLNTFLGVTTFTGAATGNFVITLPSAVALVPGTYWVSVQAVLNFTPGGEWGWNTYAGATLGSPYNWQNPGGGFGTCTAWGNGPTCVPGTNPNLGFSLIGTATVTGGIVTGGTFNWTPAAGLSSTSTNPVAASPLVTTTYTVTHNNGAGCVRTAQITINVNQRPVITTNPSNTTVCANSSASFTGAGTGAGLTYQWQFSTDNGATYNNVPAAAPYTGTQTATLTINPATTSLNGYRYRLVVSGTCPPGLGNPNISTGAILTITPLPAVSITPAGPLCGGIAGVNGVMLTTGGTALPPVPGSATATTGTVSILLPDPAPAMAPTLNILNIAGIPANASITGVSVGLGMTHTYPADMIINLKAPNGQILSLYKHNSQTDNGAASVPGAGFFNAIVNNTGTTEFKAVPTPFKYGITAPTGPFKPDVRNGSVNTGYPAGSDPAGYVSNANGFSDLYTTGASANGAWTLAMADAGGGDQGTFTGWNITINYTTPNPAVPFNYVWTPAAGLYTDPTASTPYVAGTSAPTVYAAPTVNTLYTVTITDNATLCTNTASVQVNYTPVKPIVSPTSAAMCLGDAAVPLTITSSLAPTTVTFTQNTPLNVPDGPTLPNTIFPGVVSTLNVSGIPAGAVISSMSVKINATHPFSSDLNIGLKAPNNAILNLDANIGKTGKAGANITNMVISSASATSLATATPPYTGTFAPDAVGATYQVNFPPLLTFPGGPTSPPGYNPPTVSTFNGLYSVPNGNWQLAVYDYGSGDQGQIDNWAITITYGLPSVGIWTPNGAGSGLYTDAGATTIYTGTPIQTVYAKPLVSTTYSVTVNTGTCTSAPTLVPVTVNVPVTITSQSGNATVCTDKVTTFSVTATGSSLTYQWQVSTNGGTTFTNIANGGVYSGATTSTLTITAPPTTMNGYIYRVVVSGGAPCPSSTSANRTLTVNPLPTVVIDASPRNLLPGMTTTIFTTSSPAAATYTWFRNNTVVPGATSSSLVVNIDGQGSYFVRVTDVNGCTNNSNTITIGDSTSGRVWIYPNPTAGIFQVRYNPAHNNVTPRGINIRDAHGKLVYTQNYTLGIPFAAMKVDMSNMASGVYWVEVVDIDGQRLAVGRVEILH